MPPPYRTDLADGQWERVRSAAFAALPDARPLRRVVDGLLYRQRAGCPWSLPPPDFPPPDELRHYASEWAADGTWDRIRAALTAPPPILRPPGLRRRLARAV